MVTNTLIKKQTNHYHIIIIFHLGKHDHISLFTKRLSSWQIRAQNQQLRSQINSMYVTLMYFMLTLSMFTHINPYSASI